MFSEEQAQNLSDSELVKLSLQNQYNFIHIINRYTNKLLSYIIRISGVSKDEAEDILQEVFIKVYINLNDFDTSLKFSSWIYRITYNQVVSLYRKKQSSGELKNIVIDDNLINVLSDEFNINISIDLGYKKKIIQEVFSKMKSDYRDILILKFLEEKSYNEISDILQKPLGTVGTMVNRAKKQFKEIIEKENINIF